MTRGLGRFLRHNTIALLALFLVLGGTSFAAASLINGSQIKKHSIAKNRLTNKAIKQLKGNRGKTGPQGPAGAQGQTGATGAQGVQGVQGVQGPPGPLVTTLPAGATLRGMYGWADRTGAGYHPVVPLSFPFPLAASPTVNVIAVGGAATAACPGTAANPQAAPGNLCVYQSRNDGDQAFQVLTEVAGGRFGAVLYFPIAGSTDYEYEGTWAVTASLTAAPVGETVHPGRKTN